MHFDFYALYKNYSNIDLLKIIQQPDNYQPLVVETASLILKERMVTEEELLALADKADVQATDFLEPAMIPEESTAPVKWWKTFLVFITLHLLWKLFMFGFWVWLIYMFGADANIWVEAGFAVAAVFTYYLMVKKKAWGWILFFITNTFWGISKIYYLWFLIKTQGLEAAHIKSNIILALVYLAFVSFLIRKDVSAYFQVSEKGRLLTFGITAAITFVYFFIQVFPEILATPF
jgi:hypothetical protein